MSTPKLTTTSFAILGLLAIKPWTTYELIQQVDRSLRRIWPRAQSKLYEEPKKLVALGLARATEEHVGRRPRTRYRITPKGRQALGRWMRDPGAGPVLEFEQLLKIHLNGAGSRDEVLATLAATREWVRRENEENLEAARAYLGGEGPFPARAALNLLGGRFLTDYYAMVANWADWATAIVEQWPENVADAALDLAAQEESVRIAERLSAGD
jgi:DNA-binding PadR family transcriptional regulator